MPEPGPPTKEQAFFSSQTAGSKLLAEVRLTKKAITLLPMLPPGYMHVAT